MCWKANLHVLDNAGGSKLRLHNLRCGPCRFQGFSMPSFEWTSGVRTTGMTLPELPQSTFCNDSHGASLLGSRIGSSNTYIEEAARQKQSSMAELLSKIVSNWLASQRH